MKGSTLLLQLLFVAIYLIMTVAVQCLLFMRTSVNFSDAVFSHQWLWIVYFFVSLGLTERLGRRLHSRSPTGWYGKQQPPCHPRRRYGD